MGGLADCEGAAVDAVLTCFAHDRRAVPDAEWSAGVAALKAKPEARSHTAHAPRCIPSTSPLACTHAGHPTLLDTRQVSLRAAKQFAHELLKNPERLARAEARVGGAR